MTNENPNKGVGQETIVFKERLERIKERLVELEHLVESRGLSYEFIQNVVDNITASASMTLELFGPEEELDEETKTTAEESLSLSERYLDTLNNNEEALQAEASMDIKIWEKMVQTGQQESNHVREIVAKYGTRQ